jgi:hypothetical protein
MIKNPTNQSYFYVITNKLNGKYYYGSGIKNGYKGSGKALKSAYKKYGKECFDYKLLKFFKTRAEAFEFEKRFLSLYKLDLDPMAYNICRNANGGYISANVYTSNSIFMIEYRKTKEGSQKGIKNGKANQKIYDWYNIDTQEKCSETQYDMIIRINGLNQKSASMFGYVIRGDRRHYKGWILWSNFDKYGSREKLLYAKQTNYRNSYIANKKI